MSRVPLKNRSRRRASLTLEVVVGIFIAGMIAGLAGIGLADYRRGDNLDRAYRAALWAADAQLQRIQAGAAIDSQPPAGTLPEGVRLKTVGKAGQGVWQGFTRVTVNAETVTWNTQPVRATVSGYVPAEVRP